MMTVWLIDRAGIVGAEMRALHIMECLIIDIYALFAQDMVICMYSSSEGMESSTKDFLTTCYLQ